MYSLLLVDDERLELETLRDYIAWEKLGFDRVYTVSYTHLSWKAWGWRKSRKAAPTRSAG